MVVVAETPNPSSSATSPSEAQPGPGPAGDGERREVDPAAPPEPPPHPELVPAMEAFKRGNFREVRRLTQALLARPESDLAPQARSEARALAHRIRVDPLAIGLGLASLLFFVLVVYFTLRP
jgi:hypothetical protein